LDRMVQESAGLRQHTDTGFLGEFGDFSDLHPGLQSDGADDVAQCGEGIPRGTGDHPLLADSCAGQTASSESAMDTEVAGPISV